MRKSKETLWFRVVMSDLMLALTLGFGYISALGLLNGRYNMLPILIILCPIGLVASWKMARGTFGDDRPK